MPAGSTKKEERKYEHIKDSYKDRGVSNERGRGARRAHGEQAEVQEEGRLTDAGRCRTPRHAPARSDLTLYREAAVGARLQNRDRQRPV